MTCIKEWKTTPLISAFIIAIYTMRGGNWRPAFVTRCDIESHKSFLFDDNYQSVFGSQCRKRNKWSELLSNVLKTVQK